MYTQVTIHKAAGDEVLKVATEGTDILYRVNLTVEMHNGQELEQQAKTAGYVPDLWTVETDETP